MKKRASDSGASEYESKAAKFVDQKPKSMIMSIKPMTEDNCREWLGASNRYGDKELVNHFVSQLKRIKD